MNNDDLRRRAEYHMERIAHLMLIMKNANEVHITVETSFLTGETIKMTSVNKKQSHPVIL